MIRCDPADEPGATPAREKPPSLDGQHVFVCYFDSPYAARGLVMLQSLLRHMPDARILVLAMDGLARQIIQRQIAQPVAIVGMEELHAFDPGLTAPHDRTKFEHYLTYKPVLARYAFHLGAASATYLDSDLRFFASPESVLAEIGDASIAVTPHRYARRETANLARFGRFNAGYVYCRNDPAGRKCLEDWRADCLAWCYDRSDPEGRWVDQGYLTRWPARYSGVRIITHAGVNLAHWNCDRHQLALQNGKVTADGQDLIFYHFSGLSQTASLWRHAHFFGGRNLVIAREKIYQPYIAELHEMKRRLMRDSGITGMGSVRKLPFTFRQLLTSAKWGALVLFRAWKYRRLRGRQA